MEKNLLFGVLAKTLNKSEQELTDLLYKKADDSDEIILKDDALDLALNLDEQRVKNIQANVKPDKKTLEEQYSRGKKETMEAFEKEVREKYSLESDKIGIELVEEAVSSQVKTKPKLTDDEVKKHPIYLELEKNSVTKERYETLQGEFDGFKKNQEKSEKLSRVNEFVLRELELLKPVVSENAEVRINRQKDFLAKFEQWDYQLQDGADPLILDAEGNRIEDGHGNPVAWKDFVKKNASLYYDFKVQDPKGSSGSGGDEGEKFKGIKVPESKEEYSKMIQDEPDPEKRVKIRELAIGAGLIEDR